MGSTTEQIIDEHFNNDEMRTIRLMIVFAVVLFATAANAQTEEIENAKSQIVSLFKPNRYVYYNVDGKNEKETTKHVFVFVDRIEFRFKNKNSTFYFADFCDYHIEISLDNENLVYVTIEDFEITLSGGASVKRLADNLIFIRNYYCKKNYTSQLALFEPIAIKYRALEVKPKVSEEQRKYIVQANGFNEQKNYIKAIEFYKKAIEVDQTAYPGAYSNLALLSAQIYQFNAAIYFMKKYLMLQPDAADARGAQDKIYFWEAQITK
jgi:tetratricopeptide (TPR) repeat protein